MMALSCVEDFARLLGEADFAAVELLEADAGRLVALGIDMGNVRDVQHGFLLDDTAGLPHGGAGVALHHVDALDEDAAVLGQDAQDLTGLALVLAGDDDHLVAFLDLGFAHVSRTWLPEGLTALRARARRSS